MLMHLVRTENNIIFRQSNVPDTWYDAPFPTETTPLASLTISSQAPASIAPQPNQTIADWPRRVIVPTMPKELADDDDDDVSALAASSARNDDDDGSETQKGMILTLLSDENSIVGTKIMIGE